MVRSTGGGQPCGFLYFLLSLRPSCTLLLRPGDALAWRVTHTYPGQICAAPSRAKSNKPRWAAHN